MAFSLIGGNFVFCFYVVNNGLMMRGIWFQLSVSDQRQMKAGDTNDLERGNGFAVIVASLQVFFMSVISHVDSGFIWLHSHC